MQQRALCIAGRVPHKQSTACSSANLTGNSLFKYFVAWFQLIYEPEQYRRMLRHLKVFISTNVIVHVGNGL